jgi:hypothetical protein
MTGMVMALVRMDGNELLPPRRLYADAGQRHPGAHYHLLHRIRNHFLGFLLAPPLPWRVHGLDRLAHSSALDHRAPLIRFPEHGKGSTPIWNRNA